MPRHELLEGILRAQYDLETAEPEERPRKKAEFEAAVQTALVGKRITCAELLCALRPRYRQFKKAQMIQDARRRSV